MSTPYARVIAHSQAKGCPDLITVEAGGWRPILAEQNTHRVLSRNSASSRAIPIARNLAKFDDDFMYPAVWGSEKGGMQAGPPLEGDDLADAQRLWEILRENTSSWIHDYLDRHPLDPEDPTKVRLHKALLNRWLEPGLLQVQIITGTSWDGYFWQRCHHAADANIRLMAEAIRDAIADSTPKVLEPGQYHLPYFGDQGGFEDDWTEVRYASLLDAPSGLDYDLPSPDDEITITYAKRVSAGRCARVSLVNQSGKRDIADDLKLYQRLADRREDPTDPPHASPLEHVATPWRENSHFVQMPNGRTMGPLPRLGNFRGWWQHRHELLEF